MVSNSIRSDLELLRRFTPNSKCQLQRKVGISKASLIHILTIFMNILLIALEVFHPGPELWLNGHALPFFQSG